MSRTTIVAAILLGVAGLGLVWFFTHFDYVDDREFVGMSGEARRNDFLAAERLLARMGVKVRHVKTVPELRELPENGTLVLPDRREGLTPAAREHLLEWVENGGHLITEDEDADLPDPLLDAFDVKRIKVTPPKGTSRVVEVKLPHAPRALKVEMHSQQSLDGAGATLRVRGKAATHLLHFGWGDGRVTVLNDTGFLRNRAIGRADHAEFLWQLVQFEPGTAAVFVFDNPQKLSILDWLGANAWPALVAAALVLVAWLWRVAARFGPVAPDPEPTRRRLLDHLRASGRFRWSRGVSTGIVEAAREAALRRIGREHPDFAGLPRSEQAARLVELFGIAPEDAQRVLVPPHPRTAAELMTAIGIYQHIHERLAGRARAGRL